MGEIRQTEVSEVLYDARGGPLVAFRTPDGIPPGWTISYEAGHGWTLKKAPPKPHWSAQLATWPSRRPSSINYLISFGDKVVFITDGDGRRLLGLPFSCVETLYNEVSRV
jgi:hypothetical protein